MPPQWNPYEIPDAPGLPPLVADKSPLDDILAGIPTAPAQAQRPPVIPTDLVSVVPDLPAPPAAPTAKPQPVAADPWSAIPEPPMRAVTSEPIESLYEIPSPPPLPADLAPDFSRVDYARSLDEFDAPFSVDVSTTTQKAQTAERNLETFTRALGDAQADAVAIGERLVPLEAQARTLDARIEELKGKKKRTPDEVRALSAAQVARKAITPQINELKPQQDEATARFQAAQQQVETAKQSAETARRQAETDMATVELEAERRGAAAQQAGAVLFAKESQRIEQDARQQVAKIEADETAARARMDEDRKAYRDALKAGPAKTSMVLTVASVIAEALAARQSKRAPDFGRVLGQLEQATKAQFDERVQRQLSLIAESEDSLSKAAQQKRAVDAQKAAQRAAVLQSIELEIQTKMSGARGTLAEAQLATVAGDVRAAREAAEMQAIGEQQKAQQAADKARLDRELQEAQIRKANAEAAEKERKGQGGGGRAVPTALATLDPYTVYLPGTEKAVAQFGKDAQGARRAADAMAVIEGRDAAITQINEVEAAIEDYGVKNAGDYTAWTQSPEFAELQTAIEFLGPSLARVSSGGTATSENDMAWGKGVVQVPTMTSGGKDVALAKLREARRQLEERYRGSLQKVGLPPRVQEQLIAHRRGRSESASDRSRKLIASAPAVASDAKRSLDDRLAAVEAMKEHAAGAVKRRGSEGEEPERAIVLDELNALRDVIQQIEDGDDTEDGERVRKAAMERREALLKIWRKVGADNATKRERERLESPVTPTALIESAGGIPSIR